MLDDLERAARMERSAALTTHRPLCDRWLEHTATATR
jgi:hypothetical protein